MQASDTFSKTPKGQSEIDSKTGALSMKERRVLILVNGENNAATLRQLSLCENIEEILQNLLRLEFIKPESQAPANAKAVASEDPTEAEVGPQEFMCNTLLTFGNRVRVSKLIEEINAADGIEALKALVKPWYMAISETPGGMYQADDLRKEVEKLIEQDVGRGG